MALIRAASLWGYLPYSAPSDVGFVLPVFRNGPSGSFLLQSPDIRSETVQGFVALEHAPTEELVEIANKWMLRAGEPLTYGFKQADGRVHLKSLALLKPVLDAFMDTSDDIATKLQIAELVGSTITKKDLRRRMTEVVERDSGEESSDNFIHTSVFIQAVWGRLLMKATSGENLNLLAGHRKWLLLEADPSLEGLFPLNVQEWLSDELGIVSSEIAREIWEEIPFSTDSMLPHADMKPDLLRQRISNDLDDISSESRQEARIARLIRRVMENPGLGKHLAQQFEDKAQFANKAAGLILANVNNFDLSPDTNFIEWLVDQLYALSYPRQRGVLLYELANHLADFPVFAKPILARARHSQSAAVLLAREAIENCIANPSLPRSPFNPPRPQYDYYSNRVRTPYPEKA